MTTEKKDYSDYISFLINGVNIASLFSVFTFTVITLLVTQLPDPSLFIAQVILFFLALIFELLLFIISWSFWYILYFCEYVPPMTGTAKLATLFAFAMYQMFGIVIIMMFLLLNLESLAFAAFLMWLIFIILIYFFNYRPLTRFKETRKMYRGL
ncbi:MAG: hypothetical protein ACFFE6_13825 [Candidatus Thorarchaeota archaeon]